MCIEMFLANANSGDNIIFTQRQISTKLAEMSAVVDLRRGVRSKFFQFHAVLGKISQNRMLASRRSWRRSPRGNPGSATGQICNFFLETAKNSISRIVDRDKPQPGSEYRCSVHADASRRYKPVYLGQRHHRGDAGRAQIYHQHHRQRGVHLTENTQTSSTWWVQVKFLFHESCSATECKCSAFYGKRSQLLIWDQT